MNPVTPQVLHHSDGKRQRRLSAARAAGAAVIACTVLGVTTGPAAARPNDCTYARGSLRHAQRQLDNAHRSGSQSEINFWRSVVFDAQIDVLARC